MLKASIWCQDCTSILRMRHGQLNNGISRHGYIVQQRSQGWPYRRRTLGK